VGHCSSWLSNESNIGSKVKCVFSTLFNVLNVDRADSSPLLLVAQGTGIAPFMSILQSSPQRPVTLVFGVRDNHASFICKEEILGFLNENKEHQLWLACSRDIKQNEE
jgi:sulfite reductase alpha subunit-like flavoprotein